MADTETIHQAAQTRVPFSAWLGMVLLFALFGAIVLAVIGPSQRTTDFEKRRVQKRLDALKAVKDEEKNLASYAWVDKNKGTVRIPIDRAMELTVAELSHKKPAAAYPIATPAAPTAPAAPSPAAPAPSPQAKGTPAAKGETGNQSQSGSKPAAAVTPAPAPPGTQPGPSATPAASPAAPSAKAPVSPTQTPTLKPAGSPLPVPGKDTSASPSPQ